MCGDRLEHPGARDHRPVELLGEFGVPGEVVEVVLAEEVVEGGLPGPHGVLQFREGVVERAAVHQCQRPHRPRGVRPQERPGTGEPEAVRVLRDHVQHHQVAQEGREALRVSADPVRQCLGAGLPCGCPGRRAAPAGRTPRGPGSSRPR